MDLGHTGFDRTVHFWKSKIATGGQTSEREPDTFPQYSKARSELNAK